MTIKEIRTTNIDRTIWDGLDGEIIVTKLEKGFYLEVGNEYDGTADTLKELKSFLRNQKAKFAGRI